MNKDYAHSMQDDIIRRQDAIDAWDKLSKRGRTEFDQVLMTLPSATSQSLTKPNKSCESDIIYRQDVIDAFSDVLDSDFPYISEETPRERIASIPSAEQKKGTLTKEVREALMRLTMCAREECKVCKYEDDCGFDAQYQRATENMIIISNALKEPKTGAWIDWLGKGNEWECSVCKCSIESHGSIAYRYCPMCGADMRGEEHE